ncbi:MAG: hypothetical protein R3267_04180 [Paenisporosarcina sp.]|nr:hypothetical protein [Paenisporosarcina sp.]
MKITEFFDPLDIKHLIAYQHLQQKGVWPDGFIPKDVEFESNWQMMLQSKMAELWIGTNIFVHKMQTKDVQELISLDKILEIAQEFERKIKNEG